MLRKFVSWFEIAALLAVAVFIGMLFLNDPTAPPATPAAAVEAAGGIDGGAIYGNRCAGCHGGDGSGGIGPRLAGKVVTRFPDPAAQIAVVRDGRRGMPSFATRLSPEEIAAVVEYTRTVLGS
ncbi:MAG: cytochrome c [Actinomycetia bacterium]|nr:cytochrome c [Actinomycetes bacterium]